jgi:hypothetical protein
MPVSVKTTEVIRGQYASQADLDELANTFTEWKEAGEQGEDDWYEFGKDSAYTKPLVNGDPYVLKHVHMTPVANTGDLVQWDRAWEFHARRTNDRVLVYVQDATKYHLIALLGEPTAHAVATMQTPEDLQRMRLFVQIAEDFIHTGNIIA